MPSASRPWIPPASQFQVSISFRCSCGARQALLGEPLRFLREGSYRRAGVATFDWFPSDVEAGASFSLATTSYSMPRWPVLEEGKLDAELIARVLRFTPISGKVTRPDGSPAAGILVAADGVGPAYPAGAEPSPHCSRRLLQNGASAK